AEPAGASALAGALLTYSALTGSTRHRDAAEAALQTAAEIAARDPRFAGWWLAVAEAVVAGPLQVAVVRPVQPEAGAEPTPRTPPRQGLWRIAVGSTSPGLVAVQGRPDQPGIPLLASRPVRRGRETAYICRGFVCDAPLVEPAEVAAALARRPRA
ncbi:MAG TPA: hypothetical protein VHM65_08365, partial [Candidatus Lustribacter sp.]|nr:hypothetical protein [Candidatus Lustribacter sp.]